VEFALLNCAITVTRLLIVSVARDWQHHFYAYFVDYPGAHWTIRAHRWLTANPGRERAPNVHLQLSRTQKLCRGSKHQLRGIRREIRAFH
jgi:hypothetical protein